MTHPQPPSTWRVLKLLARTAITRLLRQVQLVGQKHKGSRGGRDTGARRRGAAKWLTILVVLSMPLFMLQGLFMTAKLGALGPTLMAQEAARAQPNVDSVDPLDDLVESAKELALTLDSRTSPSGLIALPVALSPSAASDLACAGSLLLLVLPVTLLLVSLGGGNVDLGRANWSLPWLLNFPVPTRAIILAKVLEYSVVAFFPWFTLFPIVLQLLVHGGMGWSAVPIALATTLVSNFLVGATRLWIETWIRMRLSLQGVRTVQAVCSLLGLVLIFGVMALLMQSRPPTWWINAAAAAPRWIAWLPMSWPMALLQPSTALAWLGSGLGVATALMLAALAVHASVRLLRQGVMQGGGVDAGYRKTSLRARRITVLGKERLLLLRDRNFTTQALVVPVVIIALQVVMFRARSIGTPAVGGAVAGYFVALMTLLVGCFSVVTGEGRALWILYTLPIPAIRALRQKLLLWAGIGVGFAMATALAIDPGQFLTTWSGALSALVLAIGVWSAAWIGAGLAITWAPPPTDVDGTQKPKARQVYLFFAVCGIYFPALLEMTPPGQRVAYAVLFGTLAWSVWQRAGDHLALALDPSVPIPRKPAAAAAMTVITTFVVLQSTISLAVAAALGVPLDEATFGSLTVTLVAYTAAGLLALGLAALVGNTPLSEAAARLGIGRLGPTYRVRLGAASSVAAASDSRARWTLLGALTGLALGALGLAWVHIAGQWLEFPAAPSTALTRGLVLMLAVVAAPIVEEVLFRGLLVTAMRRSLSTRATVVWSAAVFTAIHPPGSWPPVFCLGLATAYLFLRSRYLPATVALHAVYNAVVVALW